MTSDSRARDILSRQSELVSERAAYEPVWEAVAEFCDPDAPDIRSGRGARRGDSQAERQERRGARVYANTINSAANRLAAGLESLIIPQSEKWHGLTTAEMDDEETDEEKEWAENLRDFLFSLRYSANSNFVPATQACLRNVVRYGPAYLYAEEGFGSTLIRYASIPVVEGYLSRNRWGQVDIFHRRYERTARQAAQLLGYEKLPARIRTLVDDPAKCEEKIALIQCIQPRDERRMYRSGGSYRYLDAAFASYHVIEDEEEIVRESGFRTFPVSAFNWRRYEGDAYGISPTIEALTTVREENAVRRSGLRALQQITDPPTASKARLDYVPVLDPGENYPGLIDDNGRPLIAPITTGQNPSYAFDYAASRAEEIRDMMFVNLFQTLVQNPQMTATEALIRQEEKGALLGPSGSIIQAGFATNLDRELGILEDKGLYDEDSRFLPPASLAGKAVRPTFTGPLDVLRRSAEARDTIQLVTTAMQMAQFDPDVMDNIDSDEALKIVQSAGRSPQRIFRRKDEVAGLRDARAKASQAQAGMAAIATAGKVAKDAVPAAVQARDSGLLEGLQGMLQGGTADGPAPDAGAQGAMPAGQRA
ncbi:MULTISPECIES: portal protein [unclassified Mesorhizobium]|uniref:portal protein n=1 Tax=unclassified Mesorhizobium TaxID=325217 RepID=UPI001127F028|nr:MULTISPECIES: portal protein [unclassified Mesorhizobium]MBZ9960842.1 phage tail protein [Mesorhizobium sp. BR1-1-14]TPI53832.1 phage tail protein [Mesorhizobium sp. B3-1-1]TPJ64696.1 phage tail protein [Mesorhizobium sp. B2-6-1]TPJ69419.1 phage tail protein [Mesorhizobium sp. B2-6-7]TPJ86491.1 phage tail protein [Mesorhizobium sp. B2-6-3]